MLYLVILALVVAAAVLSLPLLRRNHRRDEVDRFHLARSLTTSWSDGAPSKVPVDGEQPPE